MIHVQENEHIDKEEIAQRLFHLAPVRLEGMLVAEEEVDEEDHDESTDNHSHWIHGLD